jgi:hypothetical protein
MKKRVRPARPIACPHRFQPRFRSDSHGRQESCNRGPKPAAFLFFLAIGAKLNVTADYRLARGGAGETAQDTRSATGASKQANVQLVKVDEATRYALAKVSPPYQGEHEAVLQAMTQSHKRPICSEKLDIPANGESHEPRQSSNVALES